MPMQSRRLGFRRAESADKPIDFQVGGQAFDGKFVEGAYGRQNPLDVIDPM